MCYEVHGEANAYFNLISDTCTSVNAYFSPMSDRVNMNRMSSIGIRTALSNEGGGCINIATNLHNCETSIEGVTNNTVRTVGDVRVRKFGNRWRISVPNCHHTRLVMSITCEHNMLRFDISRGSNLNPSSHGLLGKQIYFDFLFHQHKRSLFSGLSLKCLIENFLELEIQLYFVALINLWIMGQRMLLL